MKHLTKLFLLAIFVIFASCQDEAVTEEATTPLAETEEALESEIIVSDGEEDASLLFDETSEQQALSLSMSSSFSRQGGSSACVPDLAGLELSLPDAVSLRTTANPGDNAYFDFDILDTDLAGTDLKGWCVDVDGYLEVEGPYVFDVYSSYEDFPADKFENPQNFPLVNWIMNQDFIGKVSPISGETYTYGMVQWAIWELLDDQNCVNCYYLTDEIKDGWKQNRATLEPVAMEIVDAAIANGQDFVPGCGQQAAIIFIAQGLNPSNQIIQSIIHMVDVPPTEEECSDCEGKVTELELEFDWCRDKYVKVYQKKENSCRATKIFGGKLTKGQKFTVKGANSDGTFGKYIYIYINHCYYTKIKVNCDFKIGPGYTKGIFDVVSGRSSKGGELCDYVKPDYKKCYRHWKCKYYKSCRYKNYRH